MRSISITFHSDVPVNKRKSVLKKINSWESIKSAGQLMPDADDAEVQRMAYAYIDDHGEIEAVSKMIEEIPEIETASVPPDRGLIMEDNSIT